MLTEVAERVGKYDSISEEVREEVMSVSGQTP